MRSTSAILLEALLRFLSEEEPFAEGAAGYSGGRDSGVLLWALVQARGARGLTAVHVDHGWRPAAERAAERVLVEGWCRRLGVELLAVPAPENPLLTEAEARKHRYAGFERFASAHPGAPFFLAHHADDQAETILMRLLQGRSWQGLGGIPSRRGPYRRPFLTLPSAVLAEVAAREAVPFHSDSTNRDLRPTRNYLRHSVFPLLKERFPRSVRALGEFGALWAGFAGPGGIHPAWVPAGGGWRIGAGLWDSWSPLNRQAQLLLLSGGASRLSRRFLEAAAAAGRRGRVQGAGWCWRRARGEVFWGPVAPAGVKEYFIQAVQGQVYNLGTYCFTWGEEGPGALRVPGVDAGRPWVWRSGQAGQKIASADDPDWSRGRRRRRFGSLDLSRAALAVQDGLVRAIVDPLHGRVVWAESEAEKLHKPEIFVTLVTVTPISTE